MTRIVLGIALGVAVYSLWRWARSLAQQDRDALDAWAARELADLLAGRGPRGAEALARVLTGQDADLETQAWLIEHEAAAELVFRRFEKRYAVELVVSCSDARRVFERPCNWEEIPATVRGRFLEREREVRLPWQAPWMKGTT